MWIGLLGPLLITTDHGTQTPVTAAKHRSLLAALAVNAGNAVPVDQLAMALWDDAAPQSWQATIRNYVRRLRVVLGAGAAARIVTSPPGYSLQADANELDLLAFENLYKAGLAAARAGAWQQASAKLSAAQALWRGTPFADIPSRHIRDAHGPYYEEARLGGLETRIDADLQLTPSRALDVIPELQRLTVLHPERERFRAQLMLALHRCGRQADALAVYRQARQFSITEFGLEPGPGLHTMHQRILAADPTLYLTS